MSRLFSLLVCFVQLIVKISVQESPTHQFPEPVLEAYSPRGFRVYVDDRNGMQLFGFQARINEDIKLNMMGDISADVTAPVDGKWSYYDPNLELKVGDKLNYWIYIQWNRAGYSKNLTWEVPALISENGGCRRTSTVASGTEGVICGGNVIFEDDFSHRNLNTSMWSVEQYIPLYNEDNYEFVSYQDVNECRYITESKLYLHPIVVSNDQLRGQLDLRRGCTRLKPDACFYEQLGANLLPPIKSGKIVSKVSFKYGKVEIRAKLPIGDWIYPQIELIPKDLNKKYPKIVIAYARGNERLTLNNGEDLGSGLLFGGYVTSSQEPQRSKFLKSIRQTAPIGQDMQVFTVIWTQSKIEVMLNNDIFGTVTAPNFSDEYRLALGVGVGGNVDFPDDVLSGSMLKPWKNNTPKQVKNFVDARRSWIGTWHDDSVALQIDYVKIYAV